MVLPCADTSPASPSTTGPSATPRYQHLADALAVPLGARRTNAPAEDLRRTDAYTRRESMALYGRTKLMTVMWTQELARLLDADKVTVNC
ncbi:hypothetical protein [Streptomyces achromogenes]|uniref:hypothetical protein n=1 Tax=Streptomyces achromogenes TaxID=67255 RepID=UPI003A8093BD